MARWPAIDLRGTGGFVVAQRQFIGKRYSFFKTDAAVADAPAWVVERLTGRVAKGTSVVTDGGIGPGSRTPVLVSLAGANSVKGSPVPSFVPE
jgi:hypothetical protein